MELIERMNELDMIVDLSHVGDRTTDEAIDAGKIVVCSHSNARSLCKNVRNKTDDQIKALAKKNGIIGVVAHPSFVKWTNTEKDELPTLDDLLDHIDYIVKFVGSEHVGFGFDFVENIIPEQQTQDLLTRPEIWGRPTSKGTYDYPVGISGISDAINVTKGLIARGYADGDILNILGRNWIRVLKRSLK
jgi:membrane dipeptidase